MREVRINGNKDGKRWNFDVPWTPRSINQCRPEACAHHFRLFLETERKGEPGTVLWPVFVRSTYMYWLEWYRWIWGKISPRLFFFHPRHTCTCTEPLLLHWTSISTLFRGWQTVEQLLKICFVLGCVVQSTLDWNTQIKRVTIYGHACQVMGLILVVPLFESSVPSPY